MTDGLGQCCGRYLGPVGFADGLWVGLEIFGPALDNNANDGSAFGVRCACPSSSTPCFMKPYGTAPV